MDNGVNEPLYVWPAFIVAVLAILVVDLGIFHRKAHRVSIREAALWTVFWVSLSMAFCGGIFLTSGSDPGLAFLTGYLIELSLSVDNMFVFVLLFTYFAVPSQYQHRVLFWGIMGALVMRGTLIGLGSVLISTFHFIIYVFGAILILSAVRMARSGDKVPDVDSNPAVRLLRRVMPITSGYEGQRFFLRRDGVLMATPLLVVLIAVETTDLIFAIDSVPAIFAITEDPFLVFTSNVCAILGLRSMYFLLAGVVDKFHYLKLGLSVILAFVGVKMLTSDVYHMPILLSLGVIGLVLAAAVVASLAFPPAEKHEPPGAPPSKEPVPGAH